MATTMTSTSTSSKPAIVIIQCIVLEETILILLTSIRIPFRQINLTKTLFYKIQTFSLLKSNPWISAMEIASALEVTETTKASDPGLGH